MSLSLCNDCQHQEVRKGGITVCSAMQQTRHLVATSAISACGRFTATEQPLCPYCIHAKKDNPEHKSPPQTCLLAGYPRNAPFSSNVAHCTGFQQKLTDWPSCQLIEKEQAWNWLLELDLASRPSCPDMAVDQSDVALILRNYHNTKDKIVRDCVDEDCPTCQGDD